ncbi:unnamed protein product [Protopolystoma xenopodis]|uniref:THO complex subunitTHOC2 C-terminal domain-containing protein n=1 Tax=Protopolystoma xenopodis TaxID=117903 RepID=A0A3S5BQL4_9PLAT|nr:unnamed protein product [Protopolystoma xenopodis]
MNSAFIAACQQVTSELAESVRPLYTPRVWDELGTGAFFVTFWCLQSGDLIVPEAAYTRQINLLKSQMEKLKANNQWTSAKKSSEVDRCQQLLDRLTDELAVRRVHVSRIRAWLAAEHDSWFQPASSSAWHSTSSINQLEGNSALPPTAPAAPFTASSSAPAPTKVDMVTQFLQLCVYPRALFTPTEDYWLLYTYLSRQS